MSYVVHEKQTEIKFLKEYYQMIRSGVKIQTMRLASKRLDVTVGDVVTAVFPGLDETLTIRITRIGYRQFQHIRLEDAKNEGYDSISGLKNDLLRIYPGLHKWDRLYYYRFELVGVNRKIDSL